MNAQTIVSTRPYSFTQTKYHTTGLYMHCTLFNVRRISSNAARLELSRPLTRVLRGNPKAD